MHFKISHSIIWIQNSPYSSLWFGERTVGYSHQGIVCVIIIIIIIIINALQYKIDKY